MLQKRIQSLDVKNVKKWLSDFQHVVQNLKRAWHEPVQADVFFRTC